MPIRNDKIRSYENVVPKLVHLITSGRIKPGDKLPTERELSAKLGLSRPVVREAFRVMESFGVVESLVGSGRYLRKVDAASYGLPEGSEHLALYLSSMEARTYLELGTVSLACCRANTADIERIRHACQKDVHVANFVHVDTEFHLSLAAASHNPVLEWAMGSQLFSIYFTGTWDFGRPERWQEIKDEHQTIYEAIAERSQTKAETALLHHLEQVRENIVNTAFRLDEYPDN
ncbi:MAG: FadR/GntR family transcriptional regulator [Negativicutes bacterium]|nr:FadR/GntR family transcriptional regulator [Negativicutes bacterium]